jgi:hypothetical protein
VRVTPPLVTRQSPARFEPGAWIQRSGWGAVGSLIRSRRERRVTNERFRPPAEAAAMASGEDWRCDVTTAQGKEGRR